MSSSDEYKRLRSFLNPAIRGKNTTSVLEALASVTEPNLIDNVKAVHDQVYIATASEQYLDQRLADYNLSRPPEVGLSDDIFRQIGIAVINKKQIRSLINTLLSAMFGEEATHATSKSSEFEPYNLISGDELKISFDGGEEITVIFDPSEFANMAAATAQEVADAITKSIKEQGKSGGAFAQNDGSGFYVALKSQTEGPQSSVTVTGGRAQNELKFATYRPVIGSATTEWTITNIAGSIARFTWTNGPDPSLGKAHVGDYVNIFGSNFISSNRGSFPVLAIQGGLVGDAYFEIENPNVVAQTALQGTSDGVLFFNPAKITITSSFRYAAIYQTTPRLLEIFIPATTKVVRRERIGAAHLHDPLDLLDDSLDLGPYIFDTEQPFVVSSIGTTISSNVGPATGRIVPVIDSSDFPDESGHILLGYGTERQEGPIPYIARPSSTSLLINPSYILRKNHPAGEDVSFISQTAAAVPSPDGTDHQFFVTNSIAGRIYAEELINTVVATGINVVITVIYPGDIGLGKHGTQYSDKFDVWGPDTV